MLLNFYLIYSTLLLIVILIIEYCLFITGESPEGLLWLQCNFLFHSLLLFVIMQITWKKQHRNTLAWNWYDV